MKTKILQLFLALTLFGCQSEKIEVDILLQNGSIYNGVSTEKMTGVIGILGDTIAYFGSEEGIKIAAKEVIDATGMIICPGFIDPHTHADRDLNKLETAANLPFLMQGITTVVVGNDGDSFYPIGEFKELYKKQGIGTNAVLLTGHGTVRKKVLGRSDRFASREDIEKMKIVFQKEMEAGGFGISTGLFYAPGSYSNTEEVIELAKVVAQYDGIYDTHLRDESTFSVGLIPAVEEAIEIGRQANLPIHISHIKCLGVDVWEESQTIVKLVEAAQKEGINVSANQYPYDASATGLLSATVPRWAESGGKDSLYIRYENEKLRKRILEDTKENIRKRGGGEKLLIVQSKDSTIVGKNLAEIANDLKLSEAETVFEVLRTGYIRVASFNMNPSDIHNFMKQNWVVFGSDGNSGHPRKYGTFPRVYDLYVKEKGIISTGEFIKKSTSITADIFKIPNRGKIEKGYFADIIIFNPETFKDKADYTDAFQLAEGLEYSFINGKKAVEKGEATEELQGKVLSKK